MAALQALWKTSAGWFTFTYLRDRGARVRALNPVYTIQPVVKPVEQPAASCKNIEPVSCKRGFKTRPSLWAK